ncbi:MAG: methyl-accepting chemotaxis protein [Scytonema sp. PMC 1069.18]|nr:methyl-accepting chemotaxis protein [Scytonema sp. PMC 1069.18]MEC4880759.1 methyl-accepting chemotaxis protein [Scytonema sp. PMC 1070.18]
MIDRFQRNKKVKLVGLKNSKSEFHTKTLLSSKANHQKNQNFLLNFYDNLPITQKYLLNIISFAFFSIFGLCIGGTLILNKTLQSQVLTQAKSKLTVLSINYNIKANQTSAIFRSLAVNPVVVDAVITYNAGQNLRISLQEEIKNLLENEVQVSQIESAILVSKDFKIIASHTSKNQNKIFNPDNLVSEVLSNAKPIKASSILKWSDLNKDVLLLPNDFKNQDALIRYTVTPVIDKTTQTVLGALVSGDVVDGKKTMMRETLEAVGGGYSAIYLRKLTGEFALATSLNQGQSQDLNKATQNFTLPKEGLSLLQAAAKSPQGKAVTGKLLLGNQTYVMAAKAIPNKIIEEGDTERTVFGKQPVAILVQGTPDIAFNNLLLNNWQIATLIVGATFAAIALWILIVKWSIIKPIQNLKQIAQKCADGDTFSRAEVFANDEIGQIAVSFNTMVDKIAEQAELLQKIEQGYSTSHVLSCEEEQQEALQVQLLDLLENIEGAARGDLTVRAEVTTGEIGTVADFFNAIVENLRVIVTKVKASVMHVNQAIGNHEGAIRHLAEEALAQATEIDRTLDAVNNMTTSIQAVDTSAQQAATVANTAAHTAKKSGMAMDMTVQNILYLRETISETAKKVRRLGESTQHISRVVALINHISMQTNLLAINAGIEASRAGEDGQGFAIVAEEVGELAAQSVAATKEIEQIVETIQLETTEVVQAMELGNTQVVESTQIVADAKHNLCEIVEISRQIDLLVQSISLATASQVETSQAISQLMKDIAVSSQRTSDSSSKIFESLVQTLQIAEELQQAVGTFQVN